MTFDVETVYNELHACLGERVRRDEPLARHCTFGVGGPADVWVSIDTSRELVDLVRMCIEEQWPLLLVGNGTNVLFADAGVRGGWRSPRRFEFSVRARLRDRRALG